jgi:hypothetical protein
VLTISGAVTGYRGGPLSGANVLAEAFADPGPAQWPAKQTTTQTDSQGRYTLSTISAGHVGLVVSKDGYMTAWKANLSPQNSIANFVLQPRVTDLSLDGTTVTGTIFGDEFMAGDDVLFGGLCARTPCKWFGFGGGFSGPDRQVEVRLRWNDPSHQLALYKSHQNSDGIFSSFDPATRYSGSSEVVAILSVNGYSDAIANAFEQNRGGPPSSSDSESFELTLRPIR